MSEKVTQVGPYKVPAGTIVFPCLYSLLMYSGNWEDPHKFDPERWLRDPNYATDPATGVPRFVPFGIGPKACIAQHLAMVQCKVGGWRMICAVHCNASCPLEVTWLNA